MDPESDNSDRESSELLILVSVEITLRKTCEKGEKAQTDSEDVCEIGVVFGVVSHGDVDEGIEVDIGEVAREIVHEVDGNACEESAVEDSTGHDRVRGVETVPCDPSSKEDTPDDDKGNHRRILPSSLGGVLQGHGSEQACECETEEKETESVEAAPVVYCRLDEARSVDGILAGQDLLAIVGGRSERECSEFLGSSVADKQDGDGGGNQDGDDDAKHSVSPSPTVLAVRTDPIGDQASDECVDDEGEGNCSLDCTSPLEGSDIGNDQTVEVRDTGIAEGVDDLTSRDGLDVVGSSSHGVPDSVKGDGNGKSDGSRKDVGDLALGRFF